MQRTKSCFSKKIKMIHRLTHKNLFFFIANRPSPECTSGYKTEFNRDKVCVCVYTYQEQGNKRLSILSI